ncbi:MAG: hypothetical protein MZV64_13455 [Ignavibacteriales bacterium]|nr:hypothetical protein [Ignavibacteriales bacterium]
MAVRIIRACREMGIAHAWRSTPSATARALHVRYADEAYAIGPTPARESYLRDRPAPRRRPGGPAPTPSTPATASSPRTPAFAARRAATPGSSSSARRPRPSTLMGSKTAARAAAIAAGVPVVPGHARAARPDGPTPRWRASPSEVGYPILHQGRRPAAAARACASVARRRRTSPAPSRRARRRRGSSFGDDARLPRAAHRCGRATSRSSCSATTTAPSCRSSSASARSSAATRR